MPTNEDWRHMTVEEREAFHRITSKKNKPLSDDAARLAAIIFPWATENQIAHSVCLPLVEALTALTAPAPEADDAE